MNRYHSSLLLPLLSAFCALLLGGCIPEESPVEPYDRGPVRSLTFPLGTEYGVQLYFDLDRGAVVQSNPITSWDLGLRSDTGGHHIILNSAPVMAAADMGAVKFEDVGSVAGARWWHDRPEGSWDSTAIGMWWEGSTGRARGHVYLIDRGYGIDGRRRGYVKLQLLGADARSYTLRFANLDGSNDATVTVMRDTLRTFTGFSFDGGGTAVQSEPPKDSWDILLTRYTHIFYNPEYTPYGVVGVLLNRARTAAVLDSVHSFDSITSADLGRYSFPAALDAIGYEWKWYDLNAGNYTVFPYFVYILRRRDGLAFKLRFVEFYNDKRERGFPKMEWGRL